MGYEWLLEICLEEESTWKLCATRDWCMGDSLIVQCPEQIYLELVYTNWQYDYDDEDVQWECMLYLLIIVTDVLLNLLSCMCILLALFICHEQMNVLCPAPTLEENNITLDTNHTTYRMYLSSEWCKTWVFFSLLIYGCTLLYWQGLPVWMESICFGETSVDRF